ncbi:nuclear transport factor 2 family protein [Winogradskyella pulchriflava]|uniref:Nuclear transport factor 2 family protein n=1 Tax=Winogradskyella pulchriflava TaxID=1110688 RepID=A0ABV6Q823_9FLAO
MKHILLLFAFGLTLSLNAQDKEQENVKATILEFFDAFHKQDTTALKDMVTDKIILQSISTDNNGKTVLKHDDFNMFMRNIASIPKDRTFEEKLLDFSIQIDGSMANAWTPYEFWYQGKFSHCGVNSFQLIKEDSKWKIMYLVDTRRRKNCQRNSED